ncbi:hypothetical protein HYV82_04055 [Candidatus Woesearchaeota archaeon]|nr:hypothetical protein [Candidatus Woesearchaeota archaeon]
MKPEEYLTEWAKNYIRHKDIVLKRIVSMEEKGGRITVRYKDRTASYEPMASMKDFEKASNEATIITFNTQDNLQQLLKGWARLVAKKLVVVMINPLSKLDNKWVIAAHIHDRICDKASFKQGMQTMFETVEPLSSEQISELCKEGKEGENI